MKRKAPDKLIFKAVQGFTLIELMISIVLGLLITAAATRVIISSSQSSAQQEAGSDALNDEAFSLSTLETSIALANYGADESSASQDRYVMNNRTPFGGVVLPSNITTPAELPDRNLPSVLGVAAQFHTQSNSTNSGSNFGGQSDQLVLQHAVPAGVDSPTDCEGRVINLPAGYDPNFSFQVSNSDANQPRFLIERYFLRADGNPQPNEPNPLALACAAAVYWYDTASSSFVFQGNGATTLTGNGSILVNRVDHFSVLLGVNTSVRKSMNPANHRLVYYTPAEYMNLPDSDFGRPKIVSIRYGLVTRSINPISTGNEQTSFNVLGENLTLQTNPKYGRQVIEKNIIVRNARGWNG